MAWRFVNQPNGLLARFSEVVDNFTHYNLTDAEAEAVARDEYDLGRMAAAEKVKRGRKDYELDGDPATRDGLGRWRDALRTIQAVHGSEEAARVRELLSRAAASAGGQA